MTQLASISLIVAMATCGSQGGGPETPEAVVREMPEPDRILDLRGGGAEVDENTMLSDLRSVRAIYLGERHDHALDHAMQHRILRTLHRDDGSLHVGMEMFQRPFQPVLDDWVAGRLDEEALRRRSEWDDRWGFDIRLYRPILEVVRSRAIPLWALNAPRELTRAVSASGIEGLSEEQRAELPELDLENEAHRAMVIGALDGPAGVEHPHTDDPEALDRLYQAQVVWDETMADGVAKALEAGASRVVVLAGAMHVRAGLGIPDRVKRRGHESYRVVLAIESEDEEAIERILQEQPRPADYLWVHD